MNGIHELVRQATRLAVETLGSEPHRTVFRFLKTKDDATGFMFRPIENTTDHNVEEKGGGQIHVHETVFYVDGDTMRDLRVYCQGKFSRARIVRIVNHKRETFKLLKERPFDELIENGVYFRLNAVQIAEKSI